jgi:anti-sigma regulatory factor (Ser/Thr protein kinase)
MSIHRTETVQLRRYRPAVRKVRTHARELADRWSLTALRDDLELAVSEVVTNAVVHGDAAEGSRISVAYRLTDECLRVEVRDRATGTPKAMHQAPGSDIAVDGRGLAVLTAVTTRWGVTPHVIGKSVWFEIGQGSPAATEDRAHHDPRPMAYGYMRAYDNAPDDRIRADEQRLRKWSETEGYALVTVYQEAVEGSLTELSALIGEINRTGVRTVVVPSIEHLGNGLLLQEHLWAEIVGRSDAEVHEADDEREAGSR